MNGAKIQANHRQFVALKSKQLTCHAKANSINNFCCVFFQVFLNEILLGKQIEMQKRIFRLKDGNNFTFQLVFSSSFEVLFLELVNWENFPNHLLSICGNINRCLNYWTQENQVSALVKLIKIVKTNLYR